MNSQMPSSEWEPFGSSQQQHAVSWRRAATHGTQGGSFMQVDGDSREALHGLGLDGKFPANRNKKPSAGWWRRDSLTSGTPAFGPIHAKTDSWQTEHGLDGLAAVPPMNTPQGWELPILLCQWEARIFARLDDMRDRVCADVSGEGREGPIPKSGNDGCTGATTVGGGWSAMVEGRLSAIAEDIMHLHEAVHDLSRRLASVVEKEKSEGFRKEADADIIEATIDTEIGSKKKKTVRGRVTRKDCIPSSQEEIREVFMACTRELRRAVKEGVGARERTMRAVVTDQLTEFGTTVEGTIRGAITETAGEMVDGMLTRVYTVIAKAIGEIRELSQKVNSYMSAQQLQDGKHKSRVEKQDLGSHDETKTVLGVSKNDFERTLIRETGTYAAQEAARQTGQQLLKEFGSTFTPAIKTEIQSCVKDAMQEELGRAVPRIIAALAETIESAAKNQVKDHKAEHIDHFAEGRDGERPQNEASDLKKMRISDEENNQGETGRIERRIVGVIENDDEISSLMNAAGSGRHEKNVTVNLGLHRLWEEESAGTEGWDESDDFKLSEGLDKHKEELESRNFTDLGVSNPRFVKSNENVNIETDMELMDQNLLSENAVKSDDFKRAQSYARTDDGNSAENWQSDNLLS